jgi:hypothetical protein
MALGTVQLGSLAVISVSTTLGGTYSPVSDITQATMTSNRPLTQTAVLQRATAYGSPGAREVTVSFTALLSVGDTGQGLLNAAEQAGTTVFLKVLPDGTNGFTIEVRVGSTTYDAAPEGYQGRNFECTAVAPGAIVGTGPLLF